MDDHARARGGVVAEIVALFAAALSTLAVTVAHLGGGQPIAFDQPLLDGSGGYTFILLDDRTGLPARFDPCTPVEYVVNPQGAPAGAVDDVHEAFLRASVATGIRFEYEGETDEAPALERSAYQPSRYGDRWAPVLIAWSDPEQLSAAHHGDVLGLGSPIPIATREQIVFVSGSILLANDRPAARPGFGHGRRWGNVALHEIGHLLGLGHTDRRGQVMYHYDGYGTGAWGDGDLAGLAHLGRDAGCLETPRPRARLR